MKTNIYNVLFVSIGVLGASKSLANASVSLETSGCIEQIESSCGRNLADEIRYTPINLPAHTSLYCTSLTTEDQSNILEFTDVNKNLIYKVTIDKDYNCNLKTADN